MEREFLTTKELAEYLRISEKTIRNKSFRIPGRTKVFGAVRYKKSEIDRKLAAGKLF